MCIVVMVARSLFSEPCAGADEKVQVTVLAVLATSKDAKVDPRLAGVAQKIQKKDPTLTGFRLSRTTAKQLAIGQPFDFPLIEKEVVSVTIDHAVDKEQRIGLTVKPPQLGQIAYTSCCGKFLLIWTDLKTKDNESVIIAIMVEPCGK